MIRYYITIAWRVLRGKPGYGMINILGLTLGISCFLLILLFVRDEVSHDRFHVNHGRMYQVGTNILQNGNESNYALISRATGEFIRDRFPEIEAQTLIQKWRPPLLWEGKYLNSDAFIFAEPDFADIFSFRVLEGDLKRALTEPYSVAITDEMKAKYFPDVNPIGRSLVVEDTLQLTINAIVEAPRKNSSIDFDCIVSYATQRTFVKEVTDWTLLNNYLYVLMSQGASPSNLQEKLQPLVMENFGDALKGSGMHVTLDAFPFDKIYLESGKQADFGVKGEMRYVYTFLSIAIFVIALAIINYVNLSTARASERAKETGIRKLCGTHRMELAYQYLGESLVLVLVSVFLSFIVVVLALPSFNLLADKAIGWTELLSLDFVLMVLGVGLGSGALAGLYPSMIMSGFKPVESLKGSFKGSKRGQWLRKSLIIVQFAVSIGLIISSVIAFRQLKFMQGKDLGFSKDQTIVIDAGTVLKSRFLQHYKTLADELTGLSGVQNVSTSSSIPGRGTPYLVTYPEGLGEGETRMMWVVSVDEAFVRTYDLELLAGRDFSKEFPSDPSEAMIINEAAVKAVGWESNESAIGKRIQVGGKKGKVVGVIKDFHYFSPKSKLEPLMLHWHPGWFDMISVRISSSNFSESIQEAAKVWERHFPENDLNYFILDDDFAKQYQADERVIKIFMIFTFVALFIAIIGLVGLTSYSTTQRLKEIGIRKVNGASDSQIVVLLSRELLALVSVAFVAASAASMYMMEDWLEKFPYRQPMDAVVFVVVGAFSLATAWSTIWLILLKASRMNPAIVLRNE